MQPLFQNRTKLTEDLYTSAIKKYYSVGHRISRVLAVSYSIILLWCAYMLIMDMNLVVGIPFVLFAIGILFWQFRGYVVTSKRSFKQFAKLHKSHYQIDMDYRFYEERLEQETEKTELTVMYKDISKVYRFMDELVLVYNNTVIIMDNGAFVKGDVEAVVELLRQNNIKIITKLI